MSSLPQQIHDSFAPLLGEPCWQVRRGYGSFLTFEFGDPHLEIYEPRTVPAHYSERVRKRLARRNIFIHGDWHLWIYCCDWLVTAHGERIGESSTHERMDRAAAELDGQALIQVHRDAETDHWFFNFDLGGQLETIPYDKPQYPQWYFHEPSGYVLTVRGSGIFSYRPGDERDEEASHDAECAAD